MSLDRCPSVRDTDRTRRALARRCAELAFEHNRLGRRLALLQAATAALILDPAQDGKRGLIATAARSVLGPRMVDLLRAAVGKGRQDDSATVEQRMRSEILENPTDPDRHVELGLHFLSRRDWLPAYACLRTAIGLARLQGQAEARIQELLCSVEDQLAPSSHKKPLTDANDLVVRGDPYARLQFLAKQAVLCAGDGSLRVCDVGGGHGFLSVLLPDADYVLVEPSVNGLRGSNLPFAEGTFDVTVCSHVLEHVEEDRRKQILSELVRVTRRCVLILGPFASTEGKPLTEQAILAATGTEWAREHLEYGLPQLHDFCGYLERRQWRFDVLPHADARVMYWQFLATHFAALAGEDHPIEQATQFYQERFDYQPANPSDPHDFLVRLWTARDED